MATRPGRLAAAGFVRLPGPERHYRRGRREYSYRAAFHLARGDTFETATKVRGKFADEFRLARQVREAARAGKLSDAKVMSTDEEVRIASTPLRRLWAGHAKREQFELGGGRRKEGEAPPERRTDYSRRVLAVLDDPGGNRRKGKKARLLEAIGRRDPKADYDVGETP